MKGTCKSLTELEYFCEEVYKATTEKLDWINPEGRQYPHDLRKPLPLVPNSQGRHVIPFHHFINNDLEYLRGGESSRTHKKCLSYQRLVEDLQLGLKAVSKELNSQSLHFSGGTLDDVRTALNGSPQGFQNGVSDLRMFGANVTFNTSAGNPVKKILLKLNLSDHRLFKDGGGEITDEELREFTSEYYIPSALHPVVPAASASIADFPVGKVGVYTRFFEFANQRVPLSLFIPFVPRLLSHLLVKRMGIVCQARRLFAVLHREIRCAKALEGDVFSGEYALVHWDLRILTQGSLPRDELHPPVPYRRGGEL
ncbi:hypothetical protein Tco_0268843 [Tanacetum coccineum]